MGYPVSLTEPAHPSGFTLDKLRDEWVCYGVLCVFYAGRGARGWAPLRLGEWVAVAYRPVSSRVATWPVSGLVVRMAWLLVSAM